MTTLFLRDSLEELPTFSVNLDRVVMNRRLVEASIACVQSFVRSPRFTQRKFYSDIVIGLLVSAVKAAGTVHEELTYDPWVNVLPEGYEDTIVELKRAYDAVVLRRKYVRDTSNRWFGVRSVESPEVAEQSCWTGVRISDVVEVGQVEYLCESIPVPDQPRSSSTT